MPLGDPQITGVVLATGDERHMGGGPSEGTERRRDSLRLATVSRAVPLVVGYGLNLVATPIVASSLGLAQFGLWALTGAFAQYGALLDLGVSRSVTRFTALHLARDDHRAADRVISTAGTLVLSMSVPLVLLGLLAAAPLANLVHFPHAGTVLSVIVASLVVLVTGQLSTVLTGAAYGREIQALPNAVVTVGGVISLGINTAAAALAHDVVIYAWSTALCNVLMMLAIALTVHTRIARLRLVRPSWKTLTELATFGIKGQSLLLSQLVVFQASKVLLGIVSGTAAAGAFELGSRLALGFRTLGGLFTGALTAPLTRGFSERGTAGVVVEADRLTTRVASLSIAPPLLGAALAPAFLAMWLGTYDSLTLAAMVALCLGFTANMLTSIQQVVAEAIGRPGLSARSAVLSAVLSVVFGTLLLLTFGPIGWVAGTGAALVVGSAYNTALVQPALGSTQLHYYRLVCGPLLFGLLAGTGAVLATHWVPMDGRPGGAVAVILGTVVFASIYLPAIVLRGYLPRHWLPFLGR